MTTYLLYIAFGILVGIFSGLMGVGGGAVMIPIMVLFIGLAQAKAHGMSLLVMLPPVALPAVIGYFRAGKLDSKDLGMAALIAVGMFCGSYFGSQLAILLDKQKGLLSMVFGILLVYLATYTALGKENMLRSILLSLVVAAVAATIIVGVKWSDQKKQAATENAAAASS